MDVIGVIIDLGQIGTIRIKATNEERERRLITLADESNTSVGITLWGRLAQIDLKPGQIVALKNCRISDYQGCSLNSSGDENSLKVNVQHQRAA